MDEEIKNPGAMLFRRRPGTRNKICSFPGMPGGIVPFRFFL
ncbi:MAG: hypothetical protein V8T86_10575 [Victivallis sp.]